MSNEIKVTFEFDEKTIRDSFDLGVFEQGDSSQEFEFRIKHNSNKPIRNCSFFISPISGIYSGTKDPISDFDLISWYANNFDGYGIEIRQEFEVYGSVISQDGKRLIDISRMEEKDIFTGSYVEMISGPVNGEKQKIIGFDPDNSMLILESDFSIPVVGERYKINIKRSDFIKSKKGTSQSNAIELLHNAGTISRFDVASITLVIRIPPFMKRSGVSFFNLNINYTPEE